MRPVLLFVAACGSTPEKGVPLTAAERLDPAACAGCHPDHHARWSLSMHAHAAEDPVFLAMNAYGQRQTGGELGDFCVQCHAPVALAQGLTTDGTNLPDLDPALGGITCAACHQIDAVLDDHNNATAWSPSAFFRGGLDAPQDTSAHGHRYSRLHDRREASSADLCGSCHDVVTPAGVHLERTYAEWQDSIYSQAGEGLQQTCGACHMPGSDGRAASIEGAPARRIHDHAMPGVDIDLTGDPVADLQRQLVQDSLDSTVFLQLEVFDYGTGVGVNVALDNIAAGHGFPSGAAHDRRAWVEVVARDAAGAVLWSTGSVGADQSLRSAMAEDAELWWLGDRALQADGTDAHMFWEVAQVQARALPAPSRHAVDDPRYEEAHQVRTFDMGPIVPATVEAAIHIRPIGLDVLDVLVDSGDLDPAVRDRMPTFTLGGSVVSWSAGESPER